MVTLCRFLDDQSPLSSAIVSHSQWMILKYRALSLPVLRLRLYDPESLSHQLNTYQYASSSLLPFLMFPVTWLQCTFQNVIRKPLVNCKYEETCITSLVASYFSTEGARWR